MTNYTKGDVVLLQFPFSDLSSTKKRPSLVLAILPGDDILLCQITSQGSIDSTKIESKDFVSGTLPVTSFAKHGKLFTADKSLVIKKAGSIRQSTLQIVIQKVIDLLNNI